MAVAESSADTRGLPAELGRIVDAHHHIWDLERHRYRWLEADGNHTTTKWIGDYSSIRRTFSIDDYLREASGAGLIKSVHVEALWGGADSIEETRWLQSVADRHGLPNAIVAAVDLCTRDVETQLDRHLKSANVRGVRMSQLSGLVSRRDFRRGFAALAERGLSYDLNIRLEEAEQGLRLAEAFPDTNVLVDNMANPESLDDAYLAHWQAAMRTLAEAPNVAMKISGLGMADHHWTADRILPWVRAAIAIFSPVRCMFGSNWPVDRLYGSYGSLVDALRKITSDLADPDREQVFRLTAERCYRI